MPRSFPAAIAVGEAPGRQVEDAMKMFSAATPAPAIDRLPVSGAKENVPPELAVHEELICPAETGSTDPRGAEMPATLAVVAALTEAAASLTLRRGPARL